jgi:hypothetical protein
MPSKSKQIWFVKAQLMRCLPKFNKGSGSAKIIGLGRYPGPAQMINGCTTHAEHDISREVVDASRGLRSGHHAQD